MFNKESVSKELVIEKQPHKIVVSLWLDNYDNIFSDFDPRSYSHRELSDDFLAEAKKISQEIEPGVLDLTLLVPSGLRDFHSEKIIRERLHSHFRKVACRLDHVYKKTIKRGVVLAVAGVISMVFATWISTMAEDGGFAMHLLRVVFEPAGWFSTWFGLDLIFYLSREDRETLQFNRKMARAKIEFDSYAASR